MPEFMLLLDNVPGAMRDLSPSEIQGILEKYNAWMGQVQAAGKLVHGRKLTDEGGKVLNRQGDRLSIVDGPYSETKEIVGGFFLVKAADYEEAVELATGCPHLSLGKVTIRQVDFMGHPET